MPLFERAKNIIITGGVFNESEPGSTGTVYLITSLLRPNLIPERTFIADVKRIKEYMDGMRTLRVIFNHKRSSLILIAKMPTVNES